MTTPPGFSGTKRAQNFARESHPKQDIVAMPFGSLEWSLNVTKDLEVIINVKHPQSDIKSSPRQVLALCFLLSLPASLEAGGVGQDWYILSREGKLIQKVDRKRGDVIDAEAGLLYRLENNELSAVSLDASAVKWSVPCSVTSTDGALLHSDPEVLALVAHGILLGYDKRTGKELYRTTLGNPKNAFGLPRNSPLPFAWGISANGEDGRALYLTQDRTATTHHAGGRQELIATQPPMLAKFYIPTGVECWQKTLQTNCVIYSISPGIIISQPGPIFFDPDERSGTRTDPFFRQPCVLHIE